MINAFLLTRQWRDTHSGIVLDYWWATEQGPCWTQITQQEIVFFVPRKKIQRIALLLQSIRGWRSSEVDLKTFRNQLVTALYFSSQRNARAAQELLLQDAIPFWEADIRPPERYLMERFITAAARINIENPQAHQPTINARIINTDYRPVLKVASIDIETSMDAKTLFSIAIWAVDEKKVFMVGEGYSTDSLLYCATQQDCLIAFMYWVQKFDPDILIGWNLIQFDLWVLESLCQSNNMSLNIARANQSIHWRQEENDTGRRFVVIPGRVALDGIELLKAANYRFETYGLQFVADALLGEGKLLHGGDRGDDIARLFVEDKATLAEYNLRDCELVWNIFHTKKLLEFAMERSQLTGLLLDRIGGSVAAFEYLYLPRLHRRGYVAPNLGELESDVISPGGHVMNSRPGIYDNVLVLDFKSLYPSIIRTFLIDPCAYWIAQHQPLLEHELLEGFNGAIFSREGHILPAIIQHLSAARDVAKKEDNAPLSHAIKIIMNSFYGVLGSTGCRFLIRVFAVQLHCEAMK